MKEIKISNSSIKGYHVFKTRPHAEIPMFVERDFHNKYDPFALIVKMPVMENIPTRLHKVILRPAKGREKCQKVKDNAEKIVGRVPANVCKILTKLLQERKIEEIQCSAVGTPTLSKNTDPQISFKRYPKSNKDRKGGGAVIPCEYKLSCYEFSFDTVLECLNELDGPEKVEL